MNFEFPHCIALPNEWSIVRVFCCCCCSHYAWYPNWVYRKTSHGKEYLRTCAYVHRVTDKIIAQRKTELVSSEYYTLYAELHRNAVTLTFIVIIVALNVINIRNINIAVRYNYLQILLQSYNLTLRFSQHCSIVLLTNVAFLLTLIIAN